MATTTHLHVLGSILESRDEFAALPPGTLLVDEGGASYRIGWRFMNPAARTIVRQNIAGQGHPEVYDLDDAPDISPADRFTVVYLGGQ